MNVLLRYGIAAIPVRKGGIVNSAVQPPLEPPSSQRVHACVQNDRERRLAAGLGGEPDEGIVTRAFAESGRSSRGTNSQREG